MSQFPAFTETEFLKPVSGTIVPARTKPFNRAKFYRTRKGLYIGNEDDLRFRWNINQVVASAPECLYVALLLKANRYSFEGWPSKEYISTFEDIASLIEAQWNGESGCLSNDGRKDTFFVENGEKYLPLNVEVLWNTMYNRWHVDFPALVGTGTHKWHAGSKILCRGTAAL